MTPACTASTLRALAVLAISCLVLIGGLLSVGAVARASSSDGCTGSYGWPVKPFQRAHPVRANFGDPRTVFHGPFTPHTVLRGGGTFSFHQGVDISAPDGSPVFAVASGRVTRARGQRVTVECPNGRSFQYWHIEPAVHVGQHAVAGETVLGSILEKREHVHLTHLERGRVVNPLAPGHLTPYADATSPKVRRIAARRGGQEIDVSQPIRGRVVFVAEAIDTPALPVPGRWHGFPVTPAGLAWRIEHRNGRVAVAERVARDVSRTVPKNDRFWRTYARDTYQNWPVFNGRKEQLAPGRYIFRLGMHPFDTRTLADGAYELVVVAEDTAGNRGEARLSFFVDNGTS